MISFDVLSVHVLPSMDPVAQHFVASRLALSPRQHIPGIKLLPKFCLIEQGIKDGYPLSMLRWLYDQFPALTTQHLWMACDRADLDILQWVCEEVIPCMVAFESVVKSGNPDCIKWMAETVRHWKHGMAKTIAKTGNLELLQWAASHGCPMNHRRLFSNAASSGSLSMMQWLFDGGLEPTTDTLRAAVKHGNLDNIKWLRLHGCPCDATAIVCAIEAHRFDLVQWLLRKGCPSGPEVVKAAVKHGCIQTLELHRQHKEWFSSHCYTVAERNNQLDVLRWLLEANLHPFTLPATLLHKPLAIHLSTITWIYEQGLWPKDISAYVVAVRRNDVAMLKWAIDNQLPLHTTSYDGWLDAIVDTQLSLEMWQTMESCGMLQIAEPNSLANAIAQNDLDIFKWLIEHGATPTSDHKRMIVCNGRFSMIKHLERLGYHFHSLWNGYALEVEDWFECSRDMVKWLLANYKGRWTAYTLSSFANKAFDALRLIKEYWPRMSLSVIELHQCHRLTSDDLQWFAQQGGQITEHCMDRAITLGDIPLLEILYSRGGALTSDLIFAAISKGHIPVVDWLFSQSKTAVDWTHCREAQQAANKKMIAWLKERYVSPNKKMVHRTWASEK